MKAFEEVNKSQSQSWSCCFFSVKTLDETCESRMTCNTNTACSLKSIKPVFVLNIQKSLSFLIYLKTQSLSWLSPLYLGTVLQCNSYTSITAWWNNHVKGQWQWWHWLNAKSKSEISTNYFISFTLLYENGLFELQPACVTVNNQQSPWKRSIKAD